MGSVHDDEPDCCYGQCCCCFTGAQKEHPVLSNVVCMKLRTNGTARLLLGVVLGFFLGLSIAYSLPDSPPDNYCSHNGAKFLPPKWAGGCNDYMFLTTTAKNALFAKNMRRDFTLCMDKKSNFQAGVGHHRLAPIDGDCVSMGRPAFILDTYSSSDIRVCMGEINGDWYATLGDYSNCSKYTTTFGSASNRSVYLKEVPREASDKSSGINYCLNQSTAVLTEARCSDSQIPIETLKETNSGSQAARQKYREDIKDYFYYNDYVFHWTSKLWISGLYLVIMPLLVANMITSIAQLRSQSSDASVKLAWMVGLYYVATTLCAAFESLILCYIMLIPNIRRFEPDKDITDIRTAATAVTPSNTYTDTGKQIQGVIKAIVPRNIVADAAASNTLGIIVFAIVIGSVVSLDSKFLQFFQDMNTMVLRMIRVLVLWTPLAVFLMITYLISVGIAYNGLSHLGTNIGLFLGTVLTGLLIHLLVVYPTIYYFLTRKNPFRVLYNISEAMLVALSISSSIATFPYTRDCAILKNGFNEKISEFVLTLGATINMDGTTIGFPIAVVFVTYAQGFSLTFGQVVNIILLSTVSSMGAAPIPQSGLVLLIVIIEQINIPLGFVFSLIIAVDPIYDRPETMVNICGDSFAAGIMHHYLHREFEKEEAKDDDEGNEVLTT